MAPSNSEENSKKATEPKETAQVAPKEEKKEGASKLTNDATVPDAKDTNASKRTLEESTNENSETKRACTGMKKESGDSNEEAETIVNKADELGYKAGDRFEVEWEVGETTRHWGATLLEYEGRTKEGYAIHTLEYDAYPEGGFNEKSTEDVVFITSYLLLDPSNADTLKYRREGEDDVVDFDEDALNDMLAKVLEKKGEQWKKLSPAQQAAVGGIIATGKERLLEAINRRWEEKPGTVITSDEVPAILEQAFQGM